MKPFRPPHRRYLSLLDDSEVIYKRMDAAPGMKRAKRLRQKRWTRMEAALTEEQLRLVIRYDDANGRCHTLLEDASFNAGYAHGVLVAEDAVGLTPGEQKLIEALRGEVVRSALSRRSLLRVLLEVTKGLVSRGEVFP